MPTVLRNVSTGGRCQGTLLWPSTEKPTFERSGRELERSFPCRKSHRLTIMSQAMDEMSVVVLNKTCRPSAVPWFIVTIIVNPIECQSGRTRPHVAEERREISTPFLAHGDSTQAIMSCERSLLTVATALGLAPSAIFSGSRKSMCSVSGRRDGTSKTPAAFARPLSQSSVIDSTFRSAVTPTVGMVGMVVDWPKNQPTVIAHAE